MKQEKMDRILRICLAAMFFILLAACTKQQQKETTVPMQSSPESTAAPSTSAPTEAESTANVAENEYFLPKEEGKNQLTLYWKSEKKVDMKTSDVWLWFEGADGRGYPFYACPYGFKCMVNVPSEVTNVGFIVRTGCSDPCGTSWGNAAKDVDADRFVRIEGDTAVYLKSGDENQYYSNDGGMTLLQHLEFVLATMLSDKELQYTIKPAYRITDMSQLKLCCEGKEVEIEKLASLGNKVTTGRLTVREPLDVTKNYELYIENYGTKTVVPTAIFDSPSFIENYTYDGNDLGATVYPGCTEFKLWAPTASKVVLNLFAAGDGGEAEQSLELVRGAGGVWSLAVNGVGHGTYYTYSVTTAVGTQEAVDPYAKSAGLNGQRGMVVDPELVIPADFENDGFIQTLNSYQDAVIWEVHVRDFSHKLAGSAYPGKYLAFTETGLKNSAGVPVGTDYLKDLGVTHVHLQPVYDFATVDEADGNAFNWGYDPQNYNVPEGSYSTDPRHGEVRILEFKQMVQALHQAGIGVVMDVVYNHTHDANSNLNKIVPYYYYRYTASGDNGGGSGCGNETASERKMFRKYMIDSVTYWAKEYHLDGFRFDLMALHDTETMQAVEQALHAVNPKCLIYGEGWTGGTSVLNTAKQTTQANIKMIKASEGAIGGIAVFNDAIRDGLKGSVFDDKDTGFINGTASKETKNKVSFGLKGGSSTPGVAWSAENAQVINYMSCHDNLTLWDKLAVSCPEASEEERLAMNKLGAAAIFLGKGTPFMLAGEEFLRTKGGDSNSYQSADEVNNLDWEALVPGSAAYDMAEFYKSLIRIRKEKSFVKEAELVFRDSGDFRDISVNWMKEGKLLAAACFNAGEPLLPKTEEIGYNILLQAYSPLKTGGSILFTLVEAAE